MRDRVTGDPRGFAFVVFGDGATVDLAMAEAKHEINRKIVVVKRAQARGVARPSIHEKVGGGTYQDEESATNS
jgi:RNA-binding protein Musashi